MNSIQADLPLEEEGPKLKNNNGFKVDYNTVKRIRSPILLENSSRNYEDGLGLPSSLRKVEKKQTKEDQEETKVDPSFPLQGCD